MKFRVFLLDVIWPHCACMDEASLAAGGVSEGGKILKSVSRYRIAARRPLS